MLTILVKTIDNTNTIISVTILFTVHYIHQRLFFFQQSSINKVNRMTAFAKWQNHCSLQWHDVDE